MKEGPKMNILELPNSEEIYIKDIFQMGHLNNSLSTRSDFHFSKSCMNLSYKFWTLTHKYTLDMSELWSSLWYIKLTAPTHAVYTINAQITQPTATVEYRLIWNYKVKLQGEAASNKEQNKLVIAGSF